MLSPGFERCSRAERDALRRLLLAATAAAGRRDPPSGLQDLVAAAPIELLPALAALHRVGGCVHDSLRDVARVPSSTLVALADQRVAASAAHLSSSRALIRMANEWDAAGIRWLAMKGPVVASVLYRDPGLRTYGDLDVLIERERLAEAVEVLEGLGYEHLIRNWPLAEWFLASEFAMVDGPVDVDVHWHLLYAHYDRRYFRIDPHSMLERARRVTVAGRTVRTFDPVDTLLHLCLHASWAGGHRLIWFKDIERSLAVEQPDLDELVARARSFRCGPSVGLALARAQRALGADVPDGLAEALTGRSLQAIERVASRISPTIRFDERDSVSRFVARSVRSQLGTTVADMGRRVVRAGHRKLPRRPHDTGDPQERSAFFGAVARSRAT
jgi:hypothetical protein